MLSVYLISDILKLFHQLIKVTFIFHLLQEKPYNTRTGDGFLFTAVQQSKTSEKALMLDTTAQRTRSLLAWLLLMQSWRKETFRRHPSSATLVLHYAVLVIWQKCGYLVSSVLILTEQYKDFIMADVLAFCSSRSSNLVLYPFLICPLIFLYSYIFLCCIQMLKQWAL